MALGRDVLHLVLAAGVDQKTDPRHVTPDKALSIVNGCYAKTGQVQKRYGSTTIARTCINASTLSEIYRLASFENQLCAFDKRTIYTRTLSGGWVQNDDVSEAAVTRSSIAQGSSSYVDPDVAYVSGYIVYAWTGGATSAGVGDVYSTILDVTTGAVVVAEQKLTTGATSYKPRLCVVGSTVCLVYGDTSGKLYLHTTTGTTWSSAAQITSTVRTTTGHFDISALSNRFFVIYNCTGANTIEMMTCNTSGSTLDFLATTETRTIHAVACKAVDGERIWYSYAYTNAGLDIVVAYGAVTNTTSFPDAVALTTVATLAAADSPALQQVAIERVSSTTAVVVWQYYTGTIAVRTSTWIKTQVVTTGPALSGPTRSLANALMVSRPFVQNSRWYMVVALLSGAYSAAGSQGTMFLVDINAHTTASTTMQPRPVATIAPRQSWHIKAQPSGGAGAFGNFPRSSSTLASGVSQSSEVFHSVAPVASTQLNRLALSDLRIDFGHYAMRQFARLGRTLYMSGGMPMAFDGVRAFEIGFPWYPDAVTVTPTGAGGSMGAGDYSWYVHYEWVDATGDVHRSAPVVGYDYSSTPTSTVTIAANGYGTLSIPTLTLTNKTEPTHATPAVALIVYRTVAGGVVPYRLTADNVPSSLENDSTVAAKTYQDSVADSDIDGVSTRLSTRPILYTYSGALENVCPPSSTLLCAHNNRLWLVGDDLRTIWYSKTYVPGEGLGFSEGLTLTVDEGGDITAIASMDDKLVVFKRDRIYVVTGDGADDNGAGSTLSAAQRLPGNVGCIDPRSVVLTPNGLMFQGNVAQGSASYVAYGGIYLLSRGLDVSYVGAPVEDSLRSYPVVTSAVLHPTLPEVRFNTKASGGSTGQTLVYNYQYNAWTISQFYDSVNAVTSVAVQDAATQLNDYYWTSSAAGLHVETPASWSDGSQFVQMTVETGWVHVAGVQGFQRARRIAVLGDKFTAHNIQIAIGHDYDTSYSQTETWPSSLLSGSVAQFKTYITNQKCQAIRFRIRDADPTPTSFGTGRGFSLAGIAVEVAGKGGIFRLSTAQGG